MKKLLLFITVIGLTVSCVRVEIDECYYEDDVCYDPVYDEYYDCLREICYY